MTDSSTKVESWLEASSISQISLNPKSIELTCTISRIWIKQLISHSVFIIYYSTCDHYIRHLSLDLARENIKMSLVNLTGNLFICPSCNFWKLRSRRLVPEWFESKLWQENGRDRAKILSRPILLWQDKSHYKGTALAG